jgi:hypothetical protein
VADAVLALKFSSKPVVFTSTNTGPVPGSLLAGGQLVSEQFDQLCESRPLHLSSLTFSLHKKH